MKLQDPVNELLLYAQTTFPLYHQSYVPIARSLLRKIRNKSFDLHESKKLWERHYTRAARAYHAELKLDHNWYDHFPQHVRDECEDGEIIQEPLEWWLVTERLFDDLCILEQPVLKTDWGYYWGRTTSGQAIELDGVIQDVARRISGGER